VLSKFWRDGLDGFDFKGALEGPQTEMRRSVFRKELYFWTVRRNGAVKFQWRLKTRGNVQTLNNSQRKAGGKREGTEKGKGDLGELVLFLCVLCVRFKVWNFVCGVPQADSGVGSCSGDVRLRCVDGEC
jgi:hypothetical protein